MNYIRRNFQEAGIWGGLALAAIALMLAGRTWIGYDPASAVAKFLRAVGLALMFASLPGLIFVYFRKLLRQRQREQLSHRPVCETCGYDLTGNVNDLCPECGSPTKRRLVARPGSQLGSVLGIAIFGTGCVLSAIMMFSGRHWMQDLGILMAVVCPIFLLATIIDLRRGVLLCPICSYNLARTSSRVCPGCGAIVEH